MCRCFLNKSLIAHLPAFKKVIMNLGSKYFSSMREFYVFTTMLYQFACPMIYLTYAYTRMSVRMSKSDPFVAISAIDSGETGCPHTDENIAVLNKKKSIKMMVAVVVTFGVCWLPYHLFNTVQIVWHDLNR